MSHRARHIAVTVALASLAGCGGKEVAPIQGKASAPSEAPALTAPQATREQFNGFSFKLPGGWSRVSSDRDKTEAMVLLGGTNWQNAKGMIKVDVGAPALPTAQEMATRVASKFGGKVASSTVDVDGEEAVSVTTSSDALSTPREILIIYRDDKAYLVMAGGEPGVDLTKAIEHIRSTWKWSP